jgi:hypothetical protein
MSSVMNQDVQPRAQRALAASAIPELRELRVEQSDDSLLICGVVSSFYHKQLAQEVVRAVCRDCQDANLDVVNRVRVR